MVHLLASAPAPRAAGRGPADDEHRAVGRLRLGEGRGGVGHAWPGGEGGNSELSSDVGPSLGRERGGLLVSRVDDADAVLRRAGQNRPDVGSVQREEVTDAGTLERERDELPSVGGIAHQVATAKGIAAVLKAASGAPSRPITITPPHALSALPSSATAPRATTVELVPCCSSTTISLANPRRMKASPLPVPHTAPKRPSA